MRQNFEQCLEWLLEHEGGFSAHKDDPGGVTMKGITANTYQKWLSETLGNDATVDEEAMRNIPDIHVEQIYREGYWDKISGDNLPSGLDWSIFDWAVNSGPGRSAKTLQRLVMVKPDGGIGPKTLAAISEYDTARLIDDMYEKRQAFYERLKTFETFSRGWTRRNDETRDQARQLASSGEA